MCTRSYSTPAEPFLCQARDMELQLLHNVFLGLLGPVHSEVDASDIRVRAILSQHVSPDQKLHPCAYFSHHLTPPERNDVRD